MASPNTLTLIAQARQAGLALIVEEEGLRIRGPKSAEAIALALLDREPEVLAILSAGAPEIVWRLDVLKCAIPQHGPIWPPKVRQTPLTDTPGHCTMCGDPLSPERAQSPWRRCMWCVRALWLALNISREDVPAPITAA